MMKKRNRSTSPSQLEPKVDSKTGYKEGETTTIDVDVSSYRNPPSNQQTKGKSKVKDPPVELLERLAGGKKQKVRYFPFNI